jgi:hypothetical protein
LLKRADASSTLRLKSRMLAPNFYDEQSHA